MASACFEIRHRGQERGRFQALGKLKANFFIVHSTEYNAAWQDAYGPAQGKVFQINWQVKAFLHCRLSTLWKRSKTKQTNKIKPSGESDGNAAVMRPPYVPQQCRPRSHSRREGAQATRIIVILAKRALIH